MTQRTGTSRSGKLYSYYACAARAQKGASACKGNAIRMELLDEKVRAALRDHLFDRQRLIDLLSMLAERRIARSAAIDGRLVALKGEIVAAEEKLKRLYRCISEGIVELDDILKDQITTLKGGRERAKAALDRARSQGTGPDAIDPGKVEAFSRLMNELLEQSDVPALKAYLRSLLGGVVVGDKTIRITGSKDVLAAAVTTADPARLGVRGFVPEWRARKDSNL